MDNYKKQHEPGGTGLTRAEIRKAWAELDERKKEQARSENKYVILAGREMRYKRDLFCLLVENDFRFIISPKQALEIVEASEADIEANKDGVWKHVTFFDSGVLDSYRLGPIDIMEIVQKDDNAYCFHLVLRLNGDVRCIAKETQEDS